MRYKMSILIYYSILILVCNGVRGLKLPGECESGEFYDPGFMGCQSCPANVSMVPSDDGFGCSCEQHSVPVGLARCRPCNATEVVSEDGAACVPRRCQTSSGKIVCRKCPGDYISVTQSIDGSPLKEVHCVKCARGFKAENNKCVKCESCVCNRHEIVVRGICVPKKYVNDRPKYEERKLHPTALLEIVKQEYLCTRYDLRACRALARMCIKSFYNPDAAGPCRAWLQPKLISHKGLPQLTKTTTSRNAMAEDIEIASGQNAVLIVMAVHTRSGGLVFLRAGENISPCLPPLEIRIGNDLSRDCYMNVSKPDVNADDVYELYLHSAGDFKPLSLSLMKPTGYYVQNGAWQSGKFKNFFVLDSALSTTANITYTTYLRSIKILVKVDRDRHTPGGLRLQLSMALQYATKPPLSDTVTTTLRVHHEMPSAGVLRGLEICGGVLGAVGSAYAVVRWRGLVRRGALRAVAASLLAAAAADALHFAILFSTVHALFGEAGTLRMSLPLSQAEETTIEALVYTVVSLKLLRLLWINWCQCRCDIFFIDWSEYHPPLKDELPSDRSKQWRAAWLAQEWARMQSKRRTSPALTAPLALGMLHLLTPWQSSLPKSRGYNWAIGSVAWWSAYCTVLLGRWLADKYFGPPTDTLPKICKNVGLSLLVFEEDLYAHYVHGRNDAYPDAKAVTGPLAKCRVVCAPQLRSVYKKLSTPDYGNLSSTEPKRILLSRFLAAFFERALDGLSWVGSERSALERLLDVELTVREGGAVSALLYDPDDGTPSCFAVTWWGEEWTLGTFDAMLFGCVLLATDQPLIAALVTLTMWKMMELSRTLFGNRNIRNKTEVEM